MRKLTTLVDDELLVFNKIIVIEIMYIPKTKLSKTLKFHYFEVVTFEILDFEGHKYGEFDYFSSLCALGPLKRISELKISKFFVFP